MGNERTEELAAIVRAGAAAREAAEAVARRSADDALYEYDVVELREKLLEARGSAPTDKLRSLLNERAADGWRLKAVVAADVAGMVTKREGWMVIFERSLRG